MRPVARQSRLVHRDCHLNFVKQYYHLAGLAKSLSRSRFVNGAKWVNEWTTN
jgi:hypothetical protein